VEKGTHALIARLLYGTGVRLMEGLRLRVKDIDFTRGQIVVRAGKGENDRVTVLPETLREGLRAHLHRVREWHDKDLAAGQTEVDLAGGPVGVSAIHCGRCLRRQKEITRDRKRLVTPPGSFNQQ